MGILDPNLSTNITANIDNPFALRFAYSVISVDVSTLVVVEVSKPTFTCEISAFIPADLVEFPSLIELLIPILSAPTFTLRLKLAILTLSPTDERIILSLRPRAYTEIGFDESPDEDIVVDTLVPVAKLIGNRGSGKTSGGLDT